MVKHTQPKSGMYLVLLPWGTIRSHTADKDSPLAVAGVADDFLLDCCGCTNVVSAARAKEMREYQLRIPNTPNINVANTGPVPPAAAIPNADGSNRRGTII